MCLGNFIPRTTYTLNSDPTYDFISRVNDTEFSMSDHCEYVESDTNYTPNRGLSVLHLNVRSLVRKLDEIKLLLNKINPDIVAICETHLHKNNEGMCTIANYSFVNLNRPSGRGGGLCLYIKNCYDFVVNNSFTTTTPHVESLFVNVNINQVNHLVGEIYRIPNTPESSFMNFMEKIADQSNTKNVIVCTDQNMDLLKIQNSNIVKLVDLLTEKHLVPTITKPTRVTKSTATLIDNIYLSENLYRNIESKILIDDLSDHYPCLLNLGSRKQKLCDKVIRGRNLCQDNVDKVCNYLSCFNWSNLQMFKSSEAFEMFEKVLTNSLDLYMPVRDRIIKPKKQIKEAWVTKGILSSVSKCKKLFYQYKSGDIEESCYKNYRNNLNRIKRAAKAKFYNDQFVKHIGNAKKSWFVLNTLLGRISDKSTCPSYIMVNGKKITDVKQVCHEFNNYFGNVGKTYHDRVLPSKKSYADYLKSRSDSDFSFGSVLDSDVLSVIRSLKNKFSSGNDGLSNNFLKRISCVLYRPLAILINISLSTSYIPLSWKNAIVCPLYKSGDHNFVN